MGEQLPGVKAIRLVLEQRVPEGYSATRAQHVWHRYPDRDPILVTEDTADVALRKVDALLKSAPERNDTEYRVVLESTEVTRRVVA